MQILQTPKRYYGDCILNSFRIQSGLQILYTLIFMKGFNWSDSGSDASFLMLMMINTVFNIYGYLETFRKDNNTMLRKVFCILKSSPENCTQTTADFGIALLCQKHIMFSEHCESPH